MSEKKTLFMETTEIPAERTAAEISAVLIRAGARQIATDYHDGSITGMRWTIKTISGREMYFAMPARVDPIHHTLLKRRTRGLTPKVKIELRRQAERVAWRQLLRWTQAQVALIECGMSEAQEVFFAYQLHVESGKTLFDLFQAHQFKMLPEAKQ